MTSRLHFWRRPPRWIFHALLTIPGLALLWNASLPGNSLIVWVIAIFVSLVAALLWAGWGLAFLITERRFSWWLVVAPVAGALLLLVDVYSLPLHARFAVSRSAFDQAARAYEAHPSVIGHDFPSADTVRRIGAYRISAVRRDGDEVIFTEVHGCDFLCDAGFIYAPDGIHTDDELVVSHLTGPWWAYYNEL